MPASPSPSFDPAIPDPAVMDQSVLDQLACPACRGSLRLSEAHLVCAACARAYPIVDGIPVLIPARAEKPQN